ncbi:MAG TPA: GNAT family N-acetyltransferase [Rugosimonospora sp.]
MLGPEDVGHRVVVRRIVGIRDHRPVYSDALGELLEYGDGGLTLATPDGPLRVPLDRVSAAKRIPQRRYGTAALERVASLAWPAPEVDRLGDWQLRAAGGWTGRGNSALPIGDPGTELPDAIEAVRRWYAGRGLPARINVPLPLAGAVDVALDARGWDRSPPVLVQTARLADLVSGPVTGSVTGPVSSPVTGPVTGPVSPDVRLDPTPSAEWLAVVAARKGGLPPEAYRLLTGPEQVRFAALYGDGELLASARGAVVSGFLHLSLVEVVPAARRRGLAGLLTRTLAGWAAQHGAHTALLQVEEHNHPAVALYARLGFTTHHSYVTRTMDPPEPAAGLGAVPGPETALG